MQTIKFTASAAYGYSGQYIAQITGRDSRYTFAREFIGRKHGKRGENSTATTDEPGLYVTCDIDRKGSKDDTFTLVWRYNGELYTLNESLKEAMAIAKRLGAREDPSEIGRVEMVEFYRGLNVDGAAKDQEEMVNVQPSAHVMIDLSGITAGKHPRREVIAARKRAMARLNGANEEEATELHPTPTNDEALGASSSAFGQPYDPATETIALAHAEHGMNRLLDLIETFPSLRHLNVTNVAEARRVAEEEGSAGARSAAEFVVWVHNSNRHNFDLAAAWAKWDLAHRAAWKAWAADPWWM